MATASHRAVLSSDASYQGRHHCVHKPDQKATSNSSLKVCIYTASYSRNSGECPGHVHPGRRSACHANAAMPRWDPTPTPQPQPRNEHPHTPRPHHFQPTLQPTPHRNQPAPHPTPQRKWRWNKPHRYPHTQPSFPKRHSPAPTPTPPKSTSGLPYSDLPVPYLSRVPKTALEPAHLGGII